MDEHTKNPETITHVIYEITSFVIRKNCEENRWMCIARAMAVYRAVPITLTTRKVCFSRSFVETISGKFQFRAGVLLFTLNAMYIALHRIYYKLIHFPIQYEDEF